MSGLRCVTRDDRYHYVHHLSPSNNFGLTEPSDRLWDAILGVRTVKKLEEFEGGGGGGGGDSGGGSWASREDEATTKMRSRGTTR